MKWLRKLKGKEWPKLPGLCFLEPVKPPLTDNTPRTTTLHNVTDIKSEFSPSRLVFLFYTGLYWLLHMLHSPWLSYITMVFRTSFRNSCKAAMLNAPSTEQPSMTKRNVHACVLWAKSSIFPTLQSTANMLKH